MIADYCAGIDWLCCKRENIACMMPVFQHNMKNAYPRDELHYPLHCYASQAVVEGGGDKDVILHSKKQSAGLTGTFMRG